MASKGTMPQAQGSPSPAPLRAVAELGEDAGAGATSLAESLEGTLLLVLARGLPARTGSHLFISRVTGATSNEFCFVHLLLLIQPSHPSVIFCPAYSIPAPFHLPSHSGLCQSGAGARAEPWSLLSSPSRELHLQEAGARFHVLPYPPPDRTISKQETPDFCPRSCPVPLPCGIFLFAFEQATWMNDAVLPTRLPG